MSVEWLSLADSDSGHDLLQQQGKLNPAKETGWSGGNAKRGYSGVLP